MAIYNISYGCLTNIGERSVNEDCADVVISRLRHAFLVCDGLGGHGNGDVASKLVVNKMKEQLVQGKSIEESIIESQNALITKQIKMNEEDSMKTTLTCLTIENNAARLGYVGDSRIYYFEKSKYKLRTQDHSVPQTLVNRGAIKEKDIRHHEDRNRLLRVMGTKWNKPMYQVIDNIPVSKHTSFLLCTDGFWELIDEKMMCKTLKKAKTPQEWLDEMEKIVRVNGQGKNMDNYTAITVFVRDK